MSKTIMPGKINGFSSFLNENTKKAAEERANRKTIVEIDISKLKDHPDNRYEINKIDSLAMLIENNRFHIEPLEVKEADENGFYTIIGGHRRKTAWQRLLDEGKTTKTTLPCLVSKFEEEVVTFIENGEEKTITFSPECRERMALIASNLGQRQEKDLEVELWEVENMDAYARAKYYAARKNKEFKGSFKNFFAEVILHMSPSDLQRKRGLLKLTPKAKKALLTDKIISETFAVEIATLSPEEQDEFIDSVVEERILGLVKEVREFKRKKAEQLATAEEEFTELIEKNEQEATAVLAEMDDSTPMNSYDDIDEDEDYEADTDTDDEPESEATPAGEKKDTDSAVTPNESGKDEFATSNKIPQSATATLSEAYEWFAREQRPFIEGTLKKAQEAKNIADAQGDNITAAFWDVRISVAKFMLENLNNMPAGIN